LAAATQDSGRSDGHDPNDSGYSMGGGGLRSDKAEADPIGSRLISYF
jgi:hypothetical protein